jgi:hypothetical protein
MELEDQRSHPWKDLGERKKEEAYEFENEQKNAQI